MRRLRESRKARLSEGSDGDADVPAPAPARDLRLGLFETRAGACMTRRSGDASTASRGRFALVRAAEPAGVHAPELPRRSARAEAES